MTELRLSDQQHKTLLEVLFRPDRDEHAAGMLAGVHRSGAGVRLLAREVLPVADDDFPPGVDGYRMIAPRFLMRAGRRAADERLALVLVHSHPGADHRVRLSRDDLAGHRSVFPHLLDITNGHPVAGVALGRHSADGEVWTREGSTKLAAMRVLGERWQTLSPEPSPTRPTQDRFDRQARLFGADGQALLRELHVGVIGAGGGGSLLIEALAHLGVGQLTIIDFDRVAEHNLSRIVGSLPRDARRTRKKVDVARRMVRRIDPTITVSTVDGDLADHTAATQFADCDALLVATDTHTSRLVANALACAHLIPTIQIGAKVDLDTRGASPLSTPSSGPSSLVTRACTALAPSTPHASA